MQTQEVSSSPTSLPFAPLECAAMMRTLTASGLALPSGNYREDDPGRILCGVFGHRFGKLTFSK